MDSLYYYKAELRDVYDGDTVRVNIDLGFGIWMRGTDGKGVGLRLFGIDTPEMKGKTKKAGIEARDYLHSRLKEAELRIKTVLDKEEKYGRILAVLLIKEGEEWVDLNQEMVAKGFATPYSGGAKAAS